MLHVLYAFVHAVVTSVILQSVQHASLVAVPCLAACRGVGPVCEVCLQRLSSRGGFGISRRCEYVSLWAPPEEVTWSEATCNNTVGVNRVNMFNIEMFFQQEFVL